MKCERQRRADESGGAIFSMEFAGWSTDEWQEKESAHALLAKSTALHQASPPGFHQKKKRKEEKEKNARANQGALSLDASETYIISFTLTQFTLEIRYRYLSSIAWLWFALPCTEGGQRRLCFSAPTTHTGMTVPA